MQLFTSSINFLTFTGCEKRCNFLPLVWIFSLSRAVKNVQLFTSSMDFLTFMGCENRCNILLLVQCGEAKRGKFLDTSHSEPVQFIKKISLLADSLISIKHMDENGFWPSLSLASAEVIRKS